MALFNPIKIVASSVLLWFALELSFFAWLQVKKVLPRLFESSKDTPLSDNPVNTVLFFDSRSPECYTNNHNADTCERKNCALRNMRLIKKLLENAKKSVDVCMFKLSNPSFTQSLRKTIQNGAKLRVFCHGNIGDHSMAVSSLQQSGAFVRGREYERGLLMHHKFVVVDNNFVITGSLNWTTSAISGNWEDEAIIIEPSIVQKFSDEFQYLWDNFNIPVNNWPTPVNLPVFPINMSVWKESPCNEVFMFREDTAACRQHMSSLKFDLQPPEHAPVCAFPVLHNLAGLLRTAERSLHVCQLLINLENVADVFKDAFWRGLEVRVVTDMHMAGCTGSQIRTLKEAGIQVRTKYYHANMHHKFIILDKKFVIFGSFNWTMQALCGNSENLICTNNSEIVNTFCEHFEDVWKEFSPIEVDRIGQRYF